MLYGSYQNYQPQQYSYCNNCGNTYYIYNVHICPAVSNPLQQLGQALCSPIPCPGVLVKTSDTSTTVPNNNLSSKPMKKLSLIAKKLLDSDLRALVKAGILDDSLNVCDTNFVLSFFVSQYKKEMAAEARKLLKEKKDEEN